jgi:hypothetical protein
MVYPVISGGAAAFVGIGLAIAAALWIAVRQGW